MQISEWWGKKQKLTLSPRDFQEAIKAKLTASEKTQQMHELVG